MKIVHLAPSAIYNENWGFQENLLPKYNVKDDNDVVLITNTFTRIDKCKTAIASCDYISDDGFRVIRIPYNSYYGCKRLENIFCKLDVSDLLDSILPDVVFFHGLQSLTMLDVIVYKKKQSRKGHAVKIIQDNHADDNNSISVDAKDFKYRLLRFCYRLFNKQTQKYVEKVYGVTPCRKSYAEEFYGIKPNKTDVLMMGADDEKLDFIHKKEIRNKIRQENNIEEDDFLIVTGGKIDSKKNIHMLMKAVEGLKNVKLLIFGSVDNSMLDEFKVLMDNKNISYVGWVASDKVYDYYFAADLVCFPGTHSVLWEQACASKIPCLFKKWNGMQHVDVGGNAGFIEDVSVESIKSNLEELVFTPKYYDMLAVAESTATDAFLYSKIAEKSLECVKEK